MASTPLEILQKYWHYDDFRPPQAEIIASVLEGNDTLALMPTGGGKSLCFQVPALAREGVTLVISPLIALMKDQVRQLRERHIPSACLIAGMGHQEIEMVLNNTIYGKIKLLYVSPERLRSRTFIDHFRQMNVSMIAVDEAHCISQWGYDFRPPYLEIANIRSLHPHAPVLALTATATPEVVQDICNHLNFRKGRLFQSSFLRPNLSYCVRKEKDKIGALLHIVQSIGGSGIVYVRNRRRTIEIARLLSEHDIPSAAYHAGIEIKERDQRQQEWTRSRNGVMVATNAFGMGINKADVRFVIHLDIPESPEAYFQEAGRAGRDGKKAFAVLVYNDEDVERLHKGLERDFPPLSFIKNVYRGVCNYYQVPVGSGLDSRYDFHLEEICHNYGFEPYTFFVALKFLEREGLIALPEHNERQSKIFIPIGKEELYRFQMENRKMGDMLTQILRLYGGIFTDFTPISETRIGKSCNLNETQVINALSELNRLQMVVYQKKTTHPQICFTSPRIEIDNVHISDRNYKELRQASEKRRNAMLQYIADTEHCRSQLLLHYFGEETANCCNVCDNCIAQNKKPNSETFTKDSLAQFVMRLLSEQSLTIRQLAQQLPTADKDQLASVVKEMLDKETITMDQDFRMSCCNS